MEITPQISTVAKNTSIFLLITLLWLTQLTFPFRSDLISQARKSLNRAPADKVLNNLIDNYSPRFGTSWASIFLYIATATICILLHILAKFVHGLFVGNLLTRCITSLEMVSDSSASHCYCCCIVSVLILHGTVKIFLSVICTFGSAEASLIITNNWYKLE